MIRRRYHPWRELIIANIVLANALPRSPAKAFGSIAAGSNPPDRSAYEPVPLRLTSCGLSRSGLAVTPSVAVRATPSTGVNVTM
jgi:hypothetical protein